MPTVFREINFSPFAKNVLDYVGREGLVTYTGQPVKIEKPLALAFTVTIGSATRRDLSNLDASYWLNSQPTGELIPAIGYTR
jgi:hypothetical protein